MRHSVQTPIPSNIGNSIRNTAYRIDRVMSVLSDLADEFDGLDTDDMSSLADEAYESCMEDDDDDL